MGENGDSENKPSYEGQPTINLSQVYAEAELDLNKSPIGFVPKYVNTSCLCLKPDNSLRKMFIKIDEFWTRIVKNKQIFENNIAKMRKCLTKFSRIVECGAVQKCVHLVDLVKSFQTSIYYLLAKIGFDTAENEPLKVWR
mgnify:CR=1 FL=1